MFDVKVSASTPAELIGAVVALAAAMQASSANPTAPVAPITPAIPTPAAATPPPATTAAIPAPRTVPVASAPAYTSEQIMTAGAALIDAGKMGELMTLLNTFEVQAVTQLKPEQMGAFATELRKLGAQI